MCVLQYYKRGFQAFVFDPNCHHEVPCPLNVAQPIDEGGRSTDATSNRRPGRPSSAEVTRYQRDHWDDKKIICCGGRGRSRRKSILGRTYHHSTIYTPIVFEEQDYGMIDFLAERDKWSETKKAETLEIHPWLRMCCYDCRYEYQIYAFLKRQDPNYKYMLDHDGENELLRGQGLRRSIGMFHTNKFLPSFYSGGAFESSHNRTNPEEFLKVRSRLESQLKLDRTRHFEKHGTPDGYLPRFVFGGNLKKLFRKASKNDLPRE